MGHEIPPCQMWTDTLHKKESTRGSPLQLYPTQGKNHTIKHLGMLIRVDYMCGKAAITLGLIKRTLPPKSTNLWSKAYKQLLRPVVAYALCSWDPLSKTNKDKLQKVQRRAGRVCFNILGGRKTSTTELFRRLEWEPLAARRHRRLCLFQAMHYREVNTVMESHIQLSTHRTSTRRHKLQYAVDHHGRTWIHPSQIRSSFRTGWVWTTPFTSAWLEPCSP